MQELKLATYNVNSVRARKELLLSWLEREAPDILCLQETKVLDVDFPFEELRKLGYECFTNGQKGYNGVAICTKLLSSKLITKTNFKTIDAQSRFIAINISDIWVLNCYFPHGDVRGSDKFNFKLSFYEEFMQFLEENFSPDLNLLLVGDMNVALEDIDVYDPSLFVDAVCTMPEERGALKKIIDWGLVDTFRTLNSSEPGYTWWEYGAAIWKNEGLRIDYILATDSIFKNFTKVWVDLWPRRRRSPKPSDHAPVIAKFTL
ncbi:MAG: exodeoxyribonuclease III [Aquificaceae bacterium]|nr:exodeoxyribonuclease III [Aquificaceae bacterium]